MSNFQNYTVDGATTPEQRELWTKQLDYMTRNNRQTPGVTVTQGGKVTEVVHGFDSQSRTHGAQTAYADPGLRPGHVMIGGVETTVDAAVAAGLMTREEANVGFKKPVDRSPIQQRGTAAGDSKGTQQQPEKAPQKATSGQQEGNDPESPEAVQRAREGAAQAASETLARLDQTVGSDAVDEGMNAVAESGYLPEADELPPGVTPGHVERIVAGYTAQADDTLSAVGASVDLLMTTLDDGELQAARMATVLGDAAKLHHLGQQAVERLAVLPTSDPEGFAELIADMRPEERKALSQAANGDWIVTFPGGRTMEFGAAVRQRIVRG